MRKERILCYVLAIMIVFGNMSGAITVSASSSATLINQELGRVYNDSHEQSDSYPTYRTHELTTHNNGLLKIGLYHINADPAEYAVFDSVNSGVYIMLTSTKPNSASDVEAMRSGAVMIQEVKFQNNNGYIYTYDLYFEVENISVNKGTYYLTVYNTNDNIGCMTYKASVDIFAVIQDTPDDYDDSEPADPIIDDETDGLEDTPEKLKNTAANPKVAKSIILTSGDQLPLININDDMYDKEDGYTNFAKTKKLITIGKYKWSDITWKSSNSKIVSVKNHKTYKNEDGEDCIYDVGGITVQKIGTCTLTATLKDGTKLKCKVTVKGKKVNVPTTVKFNNFSSLYKVMKTLPVAGDVVYITSAKSSNNKVAKFYKKYYDSNECDWYDYDTCKSHDDTCGQYNNVIKHGATGKCTITLKFSDGQTKKIKVTVTADKNGNWG